MLALLLALALVGLTVLALLLAGVIVAVVTGILVANACLVVLVLRRSPARAAHGAREPPERWRPSSFTRPPNAPADPEAEPAATLTVRRP